MTPQPWSRKRPHATIILASVVLCAYAVTGLSDPQLLGQALQTAAGMALRILPPFAMVFAILVALDRWLDPKALKRLLGAGSGARGWMLILLSGIVSAGPLYAWFPALAHAKGEGVSEGRIAGFLYARAVKPALLPVMILYFGAWYAAVFSAGIIMLAIVQGLAIDRLGGVTGG
ncbi:hypothetical protein JXB02_01580 [Candidatus Woesearchaeota archaeon]|nr:hypothetical protein [Candidatus Woesearchaeota archaeon]